jgi:diguanylate cyclase
VAAAQLDNLPGITCSIGVVQADRNDDADTLIQRADALMYEAKRAGRNRVVVETKPA